MTLIDTADAYCLDDHDTGHNERLIAKAVQSYPGDISQVIVATKGGCIRPDGAWKRNGRPDHLIAACEASLKALRVSAIDLYQLHAPDVDVPLADSVGALEKLRRAGKIRWIGLSNVNKDEIKTAQSISPITTVQNRYNPFFWEQSLQGALAYCTEQGIGYLAYSPVGGGRLNKKLYDHETAKTVAKKHGASPHAVILAWLMTKSSVIIPIPGARTPEHAQDSAKAAALTLTPEDLAQLEQTEFSKD